MAVLRRPNLPPHGVVREISRMFKEFLLRLRCEPRYMPILTGARCGKNKSENFRLGQSDVNEILSKTPAQAGVRGGLNFEHCSRGLI